MNTVKILFVLFFPLITQAAPLIDPTDFCAGNFGCSEPMHQISENYSKADGSFSKLALSAYSGACYHLNSLYDSEYAHSGVFVFEKKAEKLWATGLFGFFYSQNPYEGMSATEVSQDVLQKSKPASTNVYADHVELRYLTPVTDMHYWFRSSLDGKSLYLIGKQEDELTRNLVFCDLKAHE